MSARSTALALSLALGLPLGSAAAQAAPPRGPTQHPDILAAQAELTLYELDRPQIYDAIGRLGVFVSEQHEPAELEFAHYLRGTAALELLVLARLRHQDGHEARLAEAYGAQGDLAAAVRAELDGIRAPIFRRVIDENFALFAASVGHDAAALARVPEPRRSAVVALSVAGSMGDEDALASTPCARLSLSHEDGAIDREVLDARSCGVMSALSRGARAVHAAMSGASRGDPLLAALVDDLGEADDAIHAHVVVGRLAVASDLVGVSHAAGGGRCDALITVSTTGAHVALVPSFRLEGLDEVTVSGGAPALLAHGLDITFPELPPIARSIDEVVAALASLELDPSTHVALAVTEHTPFDRVVRVLHSMSRAGVTPTYLAGRRDEALALIPFTTARAATLEDAPLHVRLRLGGYSVAGRHGGEVSIPRVHGDEGWHFDRSTLASTISRRSFDRAAIEAMGSIDASELYAVADSLDGRAVLSLP